MTQEITPSRSQNNYEMCVFFKIVNGNNTIIDGIFIITPQSNISCIGKNHEVEFGFDKNNLYKADIFKGLILEHKIEDELATIAITLLDVINDHSSPLGVRQVVVLQAGISMGIMAGSKSEESIALDQNHILFYKTILFRRKQ